MKFVKKASLALMTIGYLIAGLNHFINPEGYIRIIPHHIPYPELLNTLAGIFEILFGLMLIFKATRPIAVWGVCLMLIAFVPVHVQMIIDAPLQLNTFTVSPLVAWLRLALQPALMVWAWWYSYFTEKSS